MEAVSRMKYRHNCNVALLLSGLPATIHMEDGNSIEMILPKLKDFYLNEDFLSLFSFIDKDIESIVGDVNTNLTHFSYLYMIFNARERDEKVTLMANSLEKAFRTFFPEFSQEGKILYVQEDVALTPELFEVIIEIIYKSLDRVRTVINDEDDEVSKMRKAAKMRADKIRQGSRKNKGQQLEDWNFLEQMMISLIYEFPQYKLEDLYELNLYTVYFMYKNISKITNYEVSRMAYANGHIKKFKYFTDK